jgi:DNA polymerase iota
VFENENPALKSLPVGVQQKSILATCNYVARAKGVKKLMLVSDAKKICPDLVIVNGEDLTRFRDVSKKLWAFLRAHSWNNRVERLGLDEVFLDATDIVAYNQTMVNRNDLTHSFFHLSEQDPEQGFAFDATKPFGCTQPRAYSDELAGPENPLYLRLLLASHFGGYLRHKIEEDFGYTSTCGISTNKVLAKLVGSQNKPKNQTTLLSLRDEDISEFLGSHRIRQVAGIGFKISHLVENYVLHGDAQANEAIPHDEDYSAKISVSQVLEAPGMSPELLEKILGGYGSERGIGEKTWNLLHGFDDTEVKLAADVPTQISIEDTYMTKPLHTPTELMRELRALSFSLLRRMRVDLIDYSETQMEDEKPQRWLAFPKTIRLSTRLRSKPVTEREPKESFARSSRSQPLPTFVFSLVDSLEQLADRLVNEVVLPLFRRLHSERQGWNLSLINVCVSNMVMAGGDESGGVGRDISVMFKTQDAKLREWTVYDPSPDVFPASKDENNSTDHHHSQQDNVEGEMVVVQDEGEDADADRLWESDEPAEGLQTCATCGHSFPVFALSAHERYHALEE